MHSSEVQKDASFGEFFRGDQQRTMRRMVHGPPTNADRAPRTVDRIGDERRHLFDGHAGQGSKQLAFSGRPFRNLGLSMKSTVDSIVWGRDMDASGQDPHRDLFKNYPQHAGKKTGIYPDVYMENRAVRSSAHSMRCTMDEVLYGRDIDNSGAAFHADFDNDYAGHAGKHSYNNSARPYYRKPMMTHESTAQDVIFGAETNRSSRSPKQESMQKHFKGYAGVKSEECVTDRASRRHGISVQASVDDIVFHHPVGGHEAEAQVFSQMYTGYAGRKSGGGVRSVAKHQDPRDPSFRGKGSRIMTARGSGEFAQPPPEPPRARSQPPPARRESLQPSTASEPEAEARTSGHARFRSPTVDRSSRAAAVGAKELYRSLSARSNASSRSQSMRRSSSARELDKALDFNPNARDSDTRSIASSRSQSMRRSSSARELDKTLPQSAATFKDPVFVDDRRARRPVGSSSDAGSAVAARSSRSSAAGSPVQRQSWSSSYQAGSAAAGSTSAASPRPPPSASASGSRRASMASSSVAGMSVASAAAGSRASRSSRNPTAIHGAWTVVGSQ